MITARGKPLAYARKGKFSDDIWLRFDYDLEPPIKEIKKQVLTYDQVKQALKAGYISPLNC